MLGCFILEVSFGRRRKSQVHGADRTNLDMQINSIEQGAGKPTLIVAHAARIPIAHVLGLTGIATAARVHCRDQLDAGGEGNMRIGARDIDLTRFKRLAQGIEHGALKLRQFVEEQYAEMGEADFAGAHL